MKYFKFLILFFTLIFGVSIAQVSVDLSGYGVNIKSGDNMSSNVNSEIIGSDVQIDGVTIINDKVFIDGVEVPRGQSVFVSKKSKKKYLIKWGKNDNISVSEK